MVVGKNVSLGVKLRDELAIKSDESPHRSDNVF